MQHPRFVSEQVSDVVTGRPSPHPQLVLALSKASKELLVIRVPDQRGDLHCACFKHISGPCRRGEHPGSLHTALSVHVDSLMLESERGPLAQAVVRPISVDVPVTLHQLQPLETQNLCPIFAHDGLPYPLLMLKFSFGKGTMLWP